MYNFKTTIRSALAVIATSSVLISSPANAQKTDNNPDLPVQCGLDIVLVLDASGSIKYTKDPSVADDQNGSIDRVAGAAKAFMNAFSNTNSRVAVVSYSHDSVEHTNYADVNPGTLSAGGIHSVAIGDAGGLAGPVPAGTTGYSEHAGKGGSTNWEAAMMSTRDMLSGATGNSPRNNVPRLVVHITDGQPTSYIDPATNSPTTGNAQLALSNAAGVAKEIMTTQNAHIYTVGVGGAANHVDKLEQISGPNVYNQADVNQTFDASTTDVILATDFVELEKLLAGFATELCAPSLTITNLVSEADTPDTYEVDAGWDFSAKPMANASTYGWVLPTATPAANKTSTTDDNGRVQFQWQLEDADNWAPGMINVKQTQKTGFDNMVEVECFRTNRSVTNQAFTANYESTTGTIDVNVEADDIVTCEVMNNSNRRDGADGSPTRRGAWWRVHPEAVAQCLSESNGMIDVGIFEVRDEAYDDEIDAYKIHDGSTKGDKDDVADRGIDLALGVLNTDTVTNRFNGYTYPTVKTECMRATRQLMVAHCNTVWMGTPGPINFDISRQIVVENCDTRGTEAELAVREANLRALRADLIQYSRSGDNVDLQRDPGAENANAYYDDPRDPRD